MTAARQAKEIGFRSLKAAADRLRISPDLLNGWYHRRPEVFRAVLVGLKTIERQENEDDTISR